MALRPRAKRKTHSVTSKKKLVTKRVTAKKRVVSKTPTQKVVKKASKGGGIKSTVAKGGRSMPANRGLEHVGNYNFLVEIDGVEVASFTQVDGLESITDVIAYRDGADITLRKMPGRTHYSNIVLKRGVTSSDELWQWRKTVTDGRLERKNGSIVILNESREAVVRYNFFEGWPCRWKSSALDAASGSTLIEELEIAIEGLDRRD